MGDIVPIFKTFEQMRTEEHRIARDHFDKWHAAYRQWDLIKATLADDGTELTKLAGDDTETALAKSEASRLKKSYGECAEFFADCALARRLRTLVDQRSEKLYGLGALAKRSQRFASVQARPYYGPAATVLQMETK
jgi:hypothetical protein